MGDRFHIFKRKGLIVQRRPRNKAFFPLALYTLSTAAGSYIVTGAAATFSLLLATSAGSYAFTGNAAPFVVSINANAASYTVTSFADTSQEVWTGLNTGLYSFSGGAATLRRNFVNWLPTSGISSSWGADAAPSSTWTKASEPTTTWTQDNVMSISPPVSK